MLNQQPYRFIVILAVAIALGIAACTTDTPTATSPPVSGNKTLQKSTTPPLAGSEDKFPIATISKLETFKHSTGTFEMLIPQGWTISDRLEEGKLAVSWVDPSKNSVISVEVFPTPADADKQDLLKVDQDFIKLEFGDFPDFFLEAPVPQKDGSLLTVWGYSFTKEKETARAVINRYLQQQGKKTIIISVGLLEQHFTKLEAPLSQVLNSFQLNPTAELPKPNPQPTPP